MLEKCIIYTSCESFEVMNKNGEILDCDIVYIGTYNMKENNAQDYSLKFKDKFYPNTETPEAVARLIRDNLKKYPEYDTMLAYADNAEYEKAIYDLLSPEEQKRVLYAGMGIQSFHLDCYPKDGRGRKRTRINKYGRQAFLMAQQEGKFKKRAPRGKDKKAQIEKLYGIYANLAKEVKKKHQYDLTPTDFDAVCAMLSSLNPQSSNREAAEKFAHCPACIRIGVFVELLAITRDAAVSNYAAKLLSPDFQTIADSMISKPSKSFKEFMMEDKTSMETTASKEKQDEEKSKDSRSEANHSEADYDETGYHDGQS